MNIPGIHKRFLVSLGVDAIYHAPDGRMVPCKAIMKDVSAEIRMTRNIDLIGSDAVASIDADIKPRRGAILTVGANTYEISRKPISAVPGLVDLGLEHITGPGHDTIDMAEQVIRSMGEPVEILDQEESEPRQVSAAVNRAALLIEDAGDGTAIETTRVVVSVRNSDRGDVGSRSIVRVDGRDRRVLRVMRTGAGLVQLVT